MRYKKELINIAKVNKVTITVCGDTNDGDYVYADTVVDEAKFNEDAFLSDLFYIDYFIKNKKGSTDDMYYIYDLSVNVPSGECGIPHTIEYIDIRHTDQNLNNFKIRLNPFDEQDEEFKEEILNLIENEPEWY